MNPTLKNESIMTENVLTPHHYVNQAVATSHNTLQVERDSSQQQQQLPSAAAAGALKNNLTLNSGVSMIDQGFNSRLQHNNRQATTSLDIYNITGGGGGLDMEDTRHNIINHNRRDSMPNPIYK